MFIRVARTLIIECLATLFACNQIDCLISFPIDIPHSRQSILSCSAVAGGKLARSNSTTEFVPYDDERVVEYFFASDASAIIEHTNRVIFLEDDDVTSVKDGRKLFDHFEKSKYSVSLMYRFDSSPIEA